MRSTKEKNQKRTSQKDKLKTYRVSQFFAIRAISGFSLSPNSKTVAYITNTNGMPNIWTIPTSGGWTDQVTLQDNAVTSLFYNPKHNEIAFLSDNQGDENHQLYYISDKGGEVRYLTPSHAGAQVQPCSFNKKGDKILFSSNKRDKRFFDTYIYDLKADTEECINEISDIYPSIATDWSSDGKYILYQKFYNNTNQDIFLYNTLTKVEINISSHKGNMKNVGGVF